MAALKGVLLRTVADANIVDVSHTVPPFDIAAGAFVLWMGTREFPPRSVHLAVVDPGVGGARGRVALETDSGRLYVGPDNGLFSLVLHQEGLQAAVRLEAPPDASPTFEGRDVFAPAAAALALGTHVQELGVPYPSTLVSLPRSSGRVIWVDRFGNLITDLVPPVTGLRVGRREVRLVARTFAEAPPHEPFVYLGSSGLIEVAVREGRADQALAAGPGTRVKPL